jgi:hypothetical protein
MGDIDNSVLNIFEAMIQSRTRFFSPDNIRAYQHDARGAIASRFLQNELCLINSVNTIYTTSTQLRTAATTLLGLYNTAPLRFAEPITVTPSNAQIESSLITAENVSSNCAICQDSITSDGVRIRQCGHIHHRACLNNWFTMSVRCPVCRHDIREAGPADQTSVVSSQTSSQSTSP